MADEYLEIDFVCHKCGTVNHVGVAIKRGIVASGADAPTTARYVQCSVATCQTWNKVELPGD